MGAWAGYAIGFGALAIVAPAAAILGRRHGRAVRGAAGLAMALMGLGQIADPPTRRLIGSLTRDPDGQAANDAPKDASSGS
jgi:hypothetical protein